MNDKAREALDQAALTGVKQIRFQMDSPSGGRCAMGVLYESIGITLGTTVSLGKMKRARKTLGLTDSDIMDIIEANDRLGWDFLTIARKIVVNDSE